MTNYVIIIICGLILLSYLFEITSKYSKIPGVMLLIVLGIVLKIIVNKFQIPFPNLEPVLPLIGTLGIILIIMEASLDLKINKEKGKVISSSIAASIILFTVFVAAGTYILHIYSNEGIRTAALNIIPIAIISSAVAIPASVNLCKSDKEFVVYESSFSDIIGILLFDFILMEHSTVKSYRI